MKAADSAANRRQGDAMSKYLLLMYQPAGPEPSADEIREEWPKWAKFEEEIKGAGVYVDNNGLARTDSATTVRVRDGERQVTDGPFAETKEYLAGYFLIDVDDPAPALTGGAAI